MPFKIVTHTKPTSEPNIIFLLIKRETMVKTNSVFRNQKLLRYHCPNDTVNNVNVNTDNINEFTNDGKSKDLTLETTTSLIE